MTTTRNLSLHKIKLCAVIAIIICLPSVFLSATIDSEPSWRIYNPNSPLLPTDPEGSKENIEANFTSDIMNGFMDNFDGLESLKDTINQSRDTILANRKGSDNIISTFYTVLSLYYLGEGESGGELSEYLTPHIIPLTNYFLSKYNSTSLHFEEPETSINYTWIKNQEYDNGEIFTKVTTEILIHEMAIISLSIMDTLEDNFDLTTRDLWESELKGTQNSDGGFGTYHTPESTIYESYMTMWTLYELNDRITGFLSATLTQNLLDYIESMQIKDDYPSWYWRGSFHEHNNTNNVDREMSYNNLMALKILDMGNVLSTSTGITIVNNFKGFLTAVDGCYNPNTYSFWWNEKQINSNLKQSIGSAVYGSIFNIIGETDTYSTELADARAHIYTRFDIEGISSGENYIFGIGTNTEDDAYYEIFGQYIITQYLSDLGHINEVLTSGEKYGIYEYLINHFQYIEGEESYVGASTISNTFYTIEQIYSQFCINAELTPDEMDFVYGKLMALYFNEDNETRYFGDSIQDFEIIIEDYWSTEFKPLTDTFYAIKALSDFGLLQRFYFEQGQKWLTVEQWISEQIDPSGNGFILDSREEYTAPSLLATYHGLTSLDLMFESNEGQTIDNYYSTGQISQLISFLDSYIRYDYENDFWYSQEQSQSNFDSTFQLFQCYEILDRWGNLDISNKVNLLYLQNYVSNELELWKLLPIEEQIQYASLFKLAYECGYFETTAGKNFVNENTKSLTIITDFLISSINNDILTRNSFISSELHFIETLRNMRNILLWFDMPSNQSPGEHYTYSIQVCSPFSKLDFSKINNLEISSSIGTTIDQNNYVMSSWWGNDIISGIVMTQFDPQDPYLWNPSINFTYNNIQYSCPLSITYTQIYTHVSTLTSYSLNDTFYYHLTINNDPCVYNYIPLPEISLYSLDEGSLDGNKTLIDNSAVLTPKINTLTRTDRIEYSLFHQIDISESMNYSLEISFSGCSWIDPIIEVFDMEYHPETSTNSQSEDSDIDDPDSGENNKNTTPPTLIPGILVAGLSVVPGKSLLKGRKKKNSTPFDDLLGED